LASQSRVTAPFRSRHVGLTIALLCCFTCALSLPLCSWRLPNSCRRAPNKSCFDRWPQPHRERAPGRVHGYNQFKKERCKYEVDALSLPPSEALFARCFPLWFPANAAAFSPFPLSSVTRTSIAFTTCRALSDQKNIFSRLRRVSSLPNYWKRTKLSFSQHSSHSNFDDLRHFRK
jgi:hypothetical protein